VKVGAAAGSGVSAGATTSTATVVGDGVAVCRGPKDSIPVRRRRRGF